MRQASHEQRVAAALAARLHGRRGEIEGAILTRALALAPPPEAAGPDYVEGLRRAVATALEHGIDGIEPGGDADPRAPEVLLAQARLAARSGVSLDTVLRRYVAGYALLGDFTVEEAEREGDIGPAELKRTLRRLAAVLDGLIAAVSAAYTEEAERRRGGGAGRRAKLVERLLTGERLDARELGYELEAHHHLGLVACGPGATGAVAALAQPLDARLLALDRPGEVVWAWLGRREPLDPEDVRRLAQAEWPPRVALAIGEPGEGRAGWRLTHRQASGGLTVALRSPHALVRYADVALLASLIQDDLLATSLRRLYLEPLEAERDGGAVLRETLRAYLACERNVTSAAAMLGVKRHTVTSRLRAAESLIGHPLSSHMADLDAALRLAELEEPPAPAESP